MNNISNPIEGQLPATYYQPADPRLLLLIIFLFSFLLTGVSAAGSAWTYALLHSPATANIDAVHLLGTLSNMAYPFHQLQTHIHDAINAAVRKAVLVMEGRVAEVMETHLLYEAVVRALEQEVKDLRRELSGWQSHEAGPHAKPRKSLSGLQARTAASDADDDSSPSSPASYASYPPFSPLQSRASSPNRHDSDSDSIYGSGSRQPAQTQSEPPAMSKEYDDELAALAGYESDDAGSSSSELDSDVDAEGETDDDCVEPAVAPTPAPAGRQIKSLAALKTKGTRR
ncbi:hypothetical protein J1614_004983 [Plenodomus biglobosus]|nr:hypothetical protein J1614_004983 [Plenodomus biglobosus]